MQVLLLLLVVMLLSQLLVLAGCQRWLPAWLQHSSC
jgi:hypothetical protein